MDGAAFARMIVSASAAIEQKKQKINELNVFPVPDGDTGTNMSMTLAAAAQDLKKRSPESLTKAADMTASALLRGARGNSGVILSLLFRGFSKSLKGKLEANGKDFAEALSAGVGGGIEMLGRYKTFSWSSLPGYGWTGITIAILAGNNPWFVPPAAFFMAYLSKGCDLMATYAKVPAQLIDIIQGVIFLFFAAEQFLSKYRQKLVVKSAEEEIARKKALEEAKEGGHANA